MPIITTTTYNATTKEVMQEEVTITAEEEQAEQQRQLILLRQEEINSLKAQLNATDYKIIKCTEYQLANLEMPYSIQDLHTQRQALRDRINILESEV